MTIQRGFAIAAASSLIGGSLGALGGWLLGRIAPDYYRMVFPLRPNLDPLQVGLGLGATQGVAAGLIVGVAIVATVAWYELKRDQAAAGRSPSV